jgi:tetratricopeptide (TPR) repeat protein/tRNA A-37 threonylcarbamoyl transferase component Bud32
VFVGKKLGHYHLLASIGEGGMGEVYKALDARLQREVAVKILAPRLVRERENIERFLREARAAAKLVHPNVITVHDVGEEDGIYYIVMEFLEGESLREMLKKRTQLDVDRAIDVAVQACQALEAAHTQGILHRDIKSDNLMMLPDGNIKVLDFGIARMVTSPALTKTGDILGTVEYMAPEQILGEEMDQRSDIYSVGVVLYEMLTGELPFTGSSPANIVYQQLEESPTPPSYLNSSIPLSVEKIVFKTLSKDPDERFPSAAELRQALQLFLKRSKLAKQTGDEVMIEEGEEWFEEKERHRDFHARLVGREREMEILRKHVGQLGQGCGRTLFMSGEAGIGKTRLVDEIEKYAHRKGILTLKGHCLYREGLEPLTPFIEAVNDFFQLKKSDSSTRRGRVKDFIRQEAPELMALSQRFLTTIDFHEDPAKLEETTQNEGTNKTRLFEVLLQVLRLISEKGPLLLVLEDIHWADSATLQLLHYVSRNSRNTPLFILATYRPEDVNPDQKGKPHSLTEAMQRMSREGSFEKIELERLSQDEHAKLVKSLFRRVDFSQDLREILFRETQGNPFFLIETLKLLRDRGVIGLVKGVWREVKPITKVDIPERVYDVVRGRIERLEEDQRDLLQYAAVIGEQFSSSLLAHGLEKKKIHILKMLHRLERVQQVIFSEGNRYVFQHPKIREVLYAEVPEELRVEYHRMIGEYLEANHKDNPEAVLNELGHHFYYGHGFDKAVTYLKRVGDRTAKLCAHREACDHYERALSSLEKTTSLSDEGDLRKEILLKAGISYDELGLWDEAQQKFDMLMKLSRDGEDVRYEAEASRQMGRTYYNKRELDKALECYLESLEKYERIEDWKKICKIHNNIGIIYYEKGNLEKMAAAYNKALEIAESVQDKNEMANVYTNLGVLHNVKGEWDKALSYYHRCISLYEEVGNAQGLARVCHNMGMTYADQKAWKISISYYEQCLKLCHDLKDIVLLSLTYLNRTEVFLHEADVRKAKESCAMSLAHFEKLGDQLGMADAYRFLGVISVREGNWDQAQVHFKESLRLNELLENPLGQAEVYREFGILHEERNEIDEALVKLRNSENLFRRLGAKEDAREMQERIKNLERSLSAQETVMKMAYS